VVLTSDGTVVAGAVPLTLTTPETATPRAWSTGPGHDDALWLDVRDGVVARLVGQYVP